MAIFYHPPQPHVGGRQPLEPRKLPPSLLDNPSPFIPLSLAEVVILAYEKALPQQLRKLNPAFLHVPPVIEWVPKGAMGAFVLTADRWRAEGVASAKTRLAAILYRGGDRPPFTGNTRDPWRMYGEVVPWIPPDPMPAQKKKLSPQNIPFPGDNPPWARRAPPYPVADAPYVYTARYYIQIPPVVPHDDPPWGVGKGSFPSMLEWWSEKRAPPWRIFTPIIEVVVPGDFPPPGRMLGYEELLTNLVGRWIELDPVSRQKRIVSAGIIPYLIINDPPFPGAGRKLLWLSSLISWGEVLVPARPVLGVAAILPLPPEIFPFDRRRMIVLGSAGDAWRAGGEYRQGRGRIVESVDRPPPRRKPGELEAAYNRWIADPVFRWRLAKLVVGIPSVESFRYQVILGGTYMVELILSNGGNEQVVMGETEFQQLIESQAILDQLIVGEADLSDIIESEG